MLQYVLGGWIQPTQDCALPTMVKSHAALPVLRVSSALALLMRLVGSSTAALPRVLVVRTACTTSTDRPRERSTRRVGARLAPHGQRPRERRVLRDGRLCDVNANAAWCNRQTFLSTWAA